MIMWNELPDGCTLGIDENWEVEKQKPCEMVNLQDEKTAAKLTFYVNFDTKKSESRKQ